MSTIKEIGILLRKEILLEWRSKYALGGILLYVMSTVFVVYNGFLNLDARVWNVCFWIISIFASVNAVAKSFISENGNRQLYYYTLASPAAVIFSKIIYNTFLLLGLNGLTFAVMSLIAGNPVKETGLFAIAILLGSAAMAASFTFISAIAGKAKNSATLTAILSFPIIIPVLMTLIKISSNALRLMTDTAVNQDIWTLVAINAMLWALAYVLFPFLWRE